jgi:hypothetical protein
LHAVKGDTLSLAKQVLTGGLDTVNRTMKDNIRLV